MTFTALIYLYTVVGLSSILFSRVSLTAPTNASSCFIMFRVRSQPPWGGGGGKSTGLTTAGSAIVLAPRVPRVPAMYTGYELWELFNSSGFRQTCSRSTISPCFLALAGYDPVFTISPYIANGFGSTQTEHTRKVLRMYLGLPACIARGRRVDAEMMCYQDCAVYSNPNRFASGPC